MSYDHEKRFFVAIQYKVVMTRALNKHLNLKKNIFLKYSFLNLEKRLELAISEGGTHVEHLLKQSFIQQITDSLTCVNFILVA